AFNDKLFEEFSKTHPEYNAENRKLFADFLKGKNISLSDKVSSYFYKQELYRYKQNPLYDLEFDQELNKALELYK
ncbi:MAG: hypothetical protein ACRCUT_13045, partial [Spirochaetota bacterium]